VGGYGLRNMRERARAVGSEVRIHSLSGGGTEVSVRLPFTATPP
jgi:signal transduction histidine kinase